MVKFLCTRQDSAERLGVQTLGFSGYLCPGTERLVDLDDLSGQEESVDHGGVSGLCLLNKTLFFIQQLTRDKVNKQNLRCSQPLQPSATFKVKGAITTSYYRTYFNVYK